MHREQKVCWQHGSDTGGSDSPPQIALHVWVTENRSRDKIPTRYVVCM